MVATTRSETFGSVTCVDASALERIELVEVRGDQTLQVDLQLRIVHGKLLIRRDG